MKKKIYPRKQFIFLTLSSVFPITNLLFNINFKFGLILLLILVAFILEAIIRPYIVIDNDIILFKSNFFRYKKIHTNNIVSHEFKKNEVLVNTNNEKVEIFIFWLNEKEKNLLKTTLNSYIDSL